MQLSQNGLLLFVTKIPGKYCPGTHVSQAVLDGQLTNYRGLVMVMFMPPSGVKWLVSMNGAVLLYISKEFL